MISVRRKNLGLAAMTFCCLFFVFNFFTRAPVICPDTVILDYTDNIDNRISEVSWENGEVKSERRSLTGAIKAAGGFVANKDDIKGPELSSYLGKQGKPLKETKPERKTELAEEYKYAVDKVSPAELLRTRFAPNSVFWVWCGRRWFEFHHYLSVLSAIKELRPDNAVFYYDTYPMQDDMHYNTWFDELKDLYPFFRPQRLTASDKGCVDHMKPNIEFIFARLSFSGGIYLNEHTMLMDFPLHWRNHSLINALTTTGDTGFILSAGGLPGSDTIDHIIRDIQYSGRTKQITCAHVDTFSFSLSKSACVTLPYVFYPKDIWELETDFGHLVRRLFYGSPDIPRPVQDFDVLVPNIAHIAWIGGGAMDYLFYLCVLSLLYVQEVDMLYIHGDAPPSGAYWESVRQHERLQLIYREVPVEVYGTRVDVLSHVTDVWRVDFMIKYGGIYVDTDTIWVRKLERDIRAYDAVASYDWTYWNHPFPDTINFGVTIGKRNAPFWHEFQKTMKWWIDSDWSWNGLRQPYRVKERKPGSMLVDPHLQVICFNYLCHPTWWPDYHNESIHHMNSPSLPDWRHDAYAYHLTLPTPPELTSPQELVKSDTIFAQMAKYVLQRAGRTPLQL